MEKHSVDGPKISILLDGDYSVLGSRLSIQADMPGMPSPYTTIPSVFILTHSPSMRIRIRGLGKRGRDYTDRKCGRGYMRRTGEKIQTKVVSHLLKTVNKNPPITPCWLGKTHTLSLQVSQVDHTRKCILHLLAYTFIFIENSLYYRATLLIVDTYLNRMKILTSWNAMC